MFKKKILRKNIKARKQSLISPYKPKAPINTFKRTLQLFLQALLANSFYITVVITLILLAFIGYNFWKNRESTIVTNIESLDTVVGLPFNIPAFKDSTFAFSNLSDNDYVKKMISYNISCYKIPFTYTFSDVKEFYSTLLPQNGWILIGEATYSDKENEVGIYYWNEELNIGLRIYTIARDVWYETLNREDTESMLATRKQLRAKMKQIIGSLHGDSLPESYPFSLKYSFQYELKEKNIQGFPSPAFSLEGRADKIEVIPFRWAPNIALDQAIPLYIQEEFADRNEVPSILGTHTQIYHDISYIVSTILINEKSYYVASFVHPGQNIIYIISGLESDPALFEFVIENMTVR
ncbi:hypothetical protein JW962_00935 [Candidatus Dojkabacteria bacterium]|nr:hypothetical protein [Candidatus Dojkabacteria bacterium]